MARSTTPRNIQPDDQEPEAPAPANNPPETDIPHTEVPFTEVLETDLRSSGAEPGFIRRHPIAIGVSAAVVAIVIVSGLTAWGVGSAVAASMTSATVSTSPSTSPNAPAAGTAGNGGQRVKQLAGGRQLVRATIASIDGSTWNVTTRSGVSGTVTVDSSTQFGTRKAPSAASDFAPGDPVIIVATPTNTSAGSLSGTADRIVLAKRRATEGGDTAQPTPMQSATPTT
jgi:hypothetical protein